MPNQSGEQMAPSKSVTKGSASLELQFTSGHGTFLTLSTQEGPQTPHAR